MSRTYRRQILRHYDPQTGTWTQRASKWIWPHRRPTSDTADPYAASRMRMVRDQLRARGIRDERVLEVMGQIPREVFVEADLGAAAYEDRALPIGCYQTISQPYMVAIMTTVLELQPHHRVLEIGTGSGYQTAILAQLAGEVYTIERIDALRQIAAQRLEALGIANVHYRVADGTLGWPDAAPFDRILVTAGAPTVPDPLRDQLADNGRLVIPVGHAKTQALTILRRCADHFETEESIACRFVPLIGEAGWSQDVPPSEEL